MDFLSPVDAGPDEVYFTNRAVAESAFQQRSGRKRRSVTLKYQGWSPIP